MMTGEKASVSWRFWLWWVLASTVGWAVGGYIGVSLGGVLSMGLAVTGYVGVAAGVIAAGALQWWVLRRQVVGAARWIVASVGGAALVGILAVVLGWAVGAVGRLIGGADWGAHWGTDWSADPGGDVGFVVAVAAGGTVLGVLHWLVLRGQVTRSGWWVLASTVGWVMGGLVSGITDTAAGWTVLGTVYGAMTGAALVWLLRRSAAGAADVTTAT